MSDTTNNYKFMGFFELLTIIFVIAKILGYITWSWYWVFAPIAIHIGLVIIVIGVVFVLCVIKAWLD